MENPSEADRPPSEAPEVPRFKSRRTMFTFLRIGNYQIRFQTNTHLTAKWYYIRKQLSWEILENDMKRKIEMDWDTILAMRVGYGSDPEVLEIELSRPPSFYYEGQLRPGTDPSWILCSDFTNGHASVFRIHHLEFPRGMLESRMERLFISDPRLRDLTGRPFPSLESPYFIGCIAGARQAPPPPPPLISSQLLPHHQIPPGHSSVPTFSSNSNVVDLILTGQHSANYGYPRPSPSSPRSRMTQYRDLSLGNSAQNATASSYDPNNTRHEPEGSHQADVQHQSELTSSSNRNLDLTLAPPSSSSSYRSDDDKNN